ncbi:GMC family oxidoreductase [Sphingomonas mali]|uniref:GMC family oxidoreductase n=1 Tax=Sphingomonas mali TaxID=40682 RepID=UPI00083120A1|nr:GMC family oxidoreductase N-terminal domain-containing protein [Sphingomonas mali]
MEQEFDVIIVGAGSAGCVLANRLSADPACRVALLEAGGEDSSYLVDIPKGFSKLVFDPDYTWNYPVRQKRGNGLDVNESWVRGRCIGGSSTINGMVYVRGQPEDYDAWTAEVGPEWSWRSMKAAFRSIEDHELGDDGVRGVGGPLHISVGNFRYPLAERLIHAGEQMGLKRKADLNQEHQEGVGYFSHNIKRGRRQSAARAFLKPVRRRSNLTVLTHAVVDRVLFEDRRAAAVEVRLAGRRVTLRARQEIILAAGAMHSPKILQLSGIGPGGLLRRHGIQVLHDSPDVGGRMLEHLGLTIGRRLLAPERGVNHRFHGLGLARSIAEYLLLGTGPLTSVPREVGAFVRVDPASTRPDVQLYLGGTSLKRPDGENTATPLPVVERVPGMAVYAQMLRLTSEGRMAISSADPDAPLDIEPNWLSTAHDKRLAVLMVRYIRRYLSMPAIAPCLGVETTPGPMLQTDDEILDAVYRNGTCGIHAVRTCRMGKDPAAVLDARCRVRGVSGLRVVDCASMPGIPSGNTNGPVMAFAWRAADLIIEDWRTS